jgi:hypothetical protein
MTPFSALFQSSCGHGNGQLERRRSLKERLGLKVVYVVRLCRREQVHIYVGGEEGVSVKFDPKSARVVVFVGLDRNANRLTALQIFVTLLGLITSFFILKVKL